MVKGVLRNYRADPDRVSMPRPGTSSDAVGDRDVYGSQQHFPLADLEVATED
jgi:hypothetical protein